MYVVVARVMIAYTAAVDGGGRGGSINKHKGLEFEVCHSTAAE